MWTQKVSNIELTHCVLSFPLGGRHLQKALLNLQPAGHVISQGQHSLPSPPPPTLPTSCSPGTFIKLHNASVSWASSASIVVQFSAVPAKWVQQKRMPWLLPDTCPLGTSLIKILCVYGTSLSPLPLSSSLSASAAVNPSQSRLGLLVSITLIVVSPLCSAFRFCGQK